MSDSTSQTTSYQTLTEEVADFLAKGPSSTAIAAFHISEEAQERVRELMRKNEYGTLTPEESAELDEITALGQLFTLVRARVLSQEQQHPSGD